MAAAAAAMWRAKENAKAGANGNGNGNGIGELQQHKQRAKSPFILNFSESAAFCS